MHKRIITTLVLAVLFMQTFAQRINTEAVGAYFTLTDSLRQNIAISPKTWNAFLQYKGIQLYVKNQGFDSLYLDQYRKAMEIVYMPKNDSILKKRLQNIEKNFLVWVINNYKTDEENFKKYIAAIQSNGNQFLQDSYQQSYAYLPKRMQKKAVNTTFYFIPLYNDALAEGNDLIFTLYCAYHFDKLAKGVLGGHELHHILRKNKQQASTKDSALYKALTLVLNEGSADLIDKKYTAAKDCPIDLTFYAYLMEEGKSYVANLDTAIQHHVAVKKIITNKDLSSIVPMSGHIPGCYMATIIERNGLKQELINSIDDPIQFVFLYNRAAKMDKDKPAVFSDSTMNYLKILAKKK